MKPALILGLMLWGSAAAVGAEECAYLSAKEFMTAVVADDGGVDVSYWSDDYFAGGPEIEEHCLVEQVEGGLWATCDGGWSGPYITAGSTLDTPSDTGIMVILNDVLYRDPACSN